MSSIAIGAGLSTDPEPVAAVRTASGEAAAALNGRTCDLAFVFVSPHHEQALAEIVGELHETLAPATLLGCSGVWIVGGSREVEDLPAISVWAGHLPQTSVKPFALEYQETPDGDTYFGWPLEVPENVSAIALADPFTFPTDDWLARVNDQHPGLAIVGGMASGGRAPGQNRLVVDREIRNGGCVGVLLSGGVKVRAAVSQGCKPVGRPYAVTGVEQNVLLSLGGRAPLERIRETYIAAEEVDRTAMQAGLHVGRVVDEYKTEFQRGDFLVRSVLGADESSGAVAIGDRVGIGETVQFHVRDAASADEDLRHVVAELDRPAGALLFTCNGRGSHLFGTPDHDAGVISSSLQTPLAGFFCAGEIGPVGGRNFLHGFTASLALFYED